MFTLCAHTIERTIEHETSGVSRGKEVHTPGDRVVLVCPHGCDDIVITVVSDDDQPGEEL